MRYSIKDRTDRGTLRSVSSEVIADELTERARRGRFSEADCEKIANAFGQAATKARRLRRSANKKYAAV